MLILVLNVSQVEHLASMFRTTPKRRIRVRKEVPVFSSFCLFVLPDSVAVALFSFSICPPNPLLLLVQNIADALNVSHTSFIA